MLQRMAQAIRANENTISAISARSRSPIGVDASMLSNNWRASVASSTGVLPVLTVWLGPRTEAAGLCGTTWPVTSQSNRWRARLPIKSGGSRSD